MQTFLKEKRQSFKTFKIKTLENRQAENVDSLSFVQPLVCYSTCVFYEIIVGTYTSQHDLCKYLSGQVFAGYLMTTPRCVLLLLRHTM